MTNYTPIGIKRLLNAATFFRNLTLLAHLYGTTESWMNDGEDTLKRISQTDMEATAQSIEAENARLRKAGEALAEAAENVHFDVFYDDAIKLQDAVATWREACGE